MGTHIERGRILYEQRRYPEAEQEFRKELAEKPNDFEPHAWLACALDVQKKSKDSINHAKQAIALSPDNSFGHYVLSHAYYGANRFKDAEIAIKEAIRLDPEWSRLYSMAAQVANEQDRWRDAADWAEQGLHNDPEDITCVNQRAYALTHLGRIEEAATSLEAALYLDPNDSTTHANMGWLLVRRNDINGAIDHFREALRLEPNSQWAYEGVVEALKARNPMYRGFLQFGLALSSLNSKMRTSLYWICWIIPPLRALLLLGVIGYWFSHTFFTLLLRLDPVGRRVLTPKEKRNNSISIAVIIFLTSGISFFVYDDYSKTTGVLDRANTLAHQGKPAQAMQLWTQILNDANNLTERKKNSRARFLYDDIKRHIDKNPDAPPELKAKVSLAYAEWNIKQHRYSAARRLLKQALEFCKGCDDPELRAKILERRAYVKSQM
jgi:tetratricopeptide (TPR) repeat protein